MVSHLVLFPRLRSTPSFPSPCPEQHGSMVGLQLACSSSSLLLQHEVFPWATVLQGTCPTMQLQGDCPGTWSSFTSGPGVHRAAPHTFCLTARQRLPFLQLISTEEPLPLLADSAVAWDVALVESAGTIWKQPREAQGSPSLSSQASPPLPAPSLDTQRVIIKHFCFWEHHKSSSLIYFNIYTGIFKIG